MRSGLALLALTAVAAAQWAAPKPMPNGDYLSNAGPVLGTVSQSYLSPGTLWRVRASALNCRQQPDRRSRVVRVFPPGTVLQADVGRGGSDEVLLNAKDGEQHTWMRVRSQTGTPYDGYVRANSRYIQPVLR